MNYFIKKLHTYYGDSEFIFNRSLSDNASKYHVTVRAGEGKAHVFTMEGSGNSWQIANGLHVPDWVLQSEQALAEEIARRNG